MIKQSLALRRPALCLWSPEHGEYTQERTQRTEQTDYMESLFTVHFNEQPSRLVGDGVARLTDRGGGELPIDTTAVQQRNWSAWH